MAIALAHVDSSPGQLQHDVFSSPVRTLRDEILFRAGEPRSHVYVVEWGIIVQYRKPAGGQPPQVVEFAFSGDAVGFGSHENYLCSAQAVGEARVRAVPLGGVEAILHNNKRALQRYAEALQREFELRRDELARVERAPPNRLAALFLALSAQNKHEGRDPFVVSDSLDCGIVADWLGLDVDALAAALVDLEHLGLIQQCPPHGLRLTDLSGLQQLADEISHSPASIDAERLSA